jgi:hypothetical protein
MHSDAKIDGKATVLTTLDDTGDCFIIRLGAIPHNYKVQNFKRLFKQR